MPTRPPSPTRPPMRATDGSPDRLAVFRGLCGGAVHLPGDPGYDEAYAALVRDLRTAAAVAG